MLIAIAFPAAAALLMEAAPYLCAAPTERSRFWNRSAVQKSHVMVPPVGRIFDSPEMAPEIKPVKMQVASPGGYTLVGTNAEVARWMAISMLLNSRLGFVTIQDDEHGCEQLVT